MKAFFFKIEFKDVTVSDISAHSLLICTEFDPTIKTIMLNCENLDMPDLSYDLVVVQDGLHHLARPVSGFTEMLRVARKAIIVIEPYDSLVGKLIGVEREVNVDSTNYVYRWDKNNFTKATKSYMLKNYRLIKVLCFWDHGLMVYNVTLKLPKIIQVTAAKIIYGLL